MTVPTRQTEGAEVAPIQRVHLFGGLPTIAVRHAFDRIRAVMPLGPLRDFDPPGPCDGDHVGVLLSPDDETSEIVEHWEANDFLSSQCGAHLRIGNVATLVDSDHLEAHLMSSDPIAAHGWSARARDVRSVADILAGQIESATHLVVTGAASAHGEVQRVLTTLNPTAEVLALDAATDPSLCAFLTAPRRGSRSSRVAGSARVVPPWLELLQAELDAPCAADRLIYRRSCPFDPERFGQWFADPPREILRAKGKLWLANSSELSMGYSCAGAVHRVFPAARWWASCSGAAWPARDEDRRRLLALWHPRFGDRRQELAFVGVDLDAAALAASLDECLLSEEEAIDAVPLASVEEVAWPGSIVSSRGGLN